MSFKFNNLILPYKLGLGLGKFDINTSMILTILRTKWVMMRQRIHSFVITKGL